MLKRRIKFTRLVIVLFLIPAWTFIGWPRIFNFLPEIQEAQAITVVAPSTDVCNCNQLTVSNHNISGSNPLILAMSAHQDADKDYRLSNVKYNGIKRYRI